MNVVRVFPFPIIYCLSSITDKSMLNNFQFQQSTHCKTKVSTFFFCFVTYITSIELEYFKIKEDVYLVYQEFCTLHTTIDRVDSEAIFLETLRLWKHKNVIHYHFDFDFIKCLVGTWNIAQILFDT